MSEIRSQTALTYRFDSNSDGTAKLRLENVSLSNLATDSRFEIACASQRPDCLAPRSDTQTYHSLGRIAPVSPNDVSAVSAPDGAALVATLVPGAVLSITVQRSAKALADGDRVEFFYTANRDTPQALLLLDAGSWTAFFVDNYFDIMILAFLVALVGLAGVIIWPVLGPLRRYLLRKPSTDKGKAKQEDAE